MRKEPLVERIAISLLIGGLIGVAIAVIPVEAVYNVLHRKPKR